MARVRKPTRSKGRPRPERGSYWLPAVLGAGLVGGALLAFVVVSLIGADAAAWLSDFVKSPGFGGICAIVVALIAFVGISRQVGVSKQAIEQARRSSADSLSSSREALEHQREKDAASAWWERFEWAASRAIPADEKAAPFPYRAVLSTFEALMKDARDEVQQAAIAAVMDEASRRESFASRPDQGDDAAQTQRDAVRSALDNFVRATRETPARSLETEFRLYELEVLDALSRLEQRGIRILTELRVSGQRTQLGFIPDAVVLVSGQSVIVEIRAGSKRDTMPRILIESFVNRLRANSITTPVVVVTPARVPSQPEGVDGVSLRLVQWRGSKDDGALFEALLAAARTSPSATG